MKLIQTKLARSIWLFDIRDLNPKGKDLIGDLVGWIKDRFNFAVAPDPDNPVPNQVPTTTPTNQQSSTPPQAPGGLIFQRGSFETAENTFVEIVALTIYDDGIV